MGIGRLGLQVSRGLREVEEGLTGYGGVPVLCSASGIFSRRADSSHRHYGSGCHFRIHYAFGAADRGYAVF